MALIYQLVTEVRASKQAGRKEEEFSEAVAGSVLELE